MKKELGKIGLEEPGLPDRLFDTAREYAEAVKRVAAEEKVAVLDIWTRLWDACGRKEEGLERYLSDGLHLTQEGYQVCSTRWNTS